MNGDNSARLSAVEMQQWMTDEGLNALAARLDAADRELVQLRQDHAQEMAAAIAGLDAALAEIDRLRALLPPGVA